MTMPTTMPEALTEIEELRGQVRNLLYLLGQGAQPSAAGDDPSLAQATGVFEFSEGLVPKQAGKATTQYLLDLHQMIETVPDVIFKLDLQGNMTGWNKRQAIVTGYSPQELANKPALLFVPQHEHAQTAAAIQRVFQDGYAELEGHMLTKDGRTIPYHWTGAALKDEQGLVIGITGVGRDVSERSRNEERLRELNLALSQAMPGISRLDSNGHYLEVNDLYAGMLGYEPTELIGRTWTPTVHPDDLWLANSAYQRMQETGKGEFEARGVKKDGSIIWKHVLMVKGVLKTSNQIGHHCFARDITERKKSEENFRLFRALLDRVTDSIEVIDPASGRFLDSNRQAYESIGYTRGELLAMAVPDIDPLVPPPVFQKLMQDLRETQVPLRLESVHRRKDGTTFPVEVSAQLLSHDREYLVAIVRDITERKRFLEAQERSRLLLQSFVEHTPAAVAMLDKELRYLAVSKRWLRDYQLGERNLIGLHHYDVFPEVREMKEWMKSHQRCLAGAVEQCEEDRFVRADGSESWMRWEVRPWEDETGAIGGIIMFTEVITDRKRAAEELRRSYHRLQQLSREVQWAEEKERRRLSRELHDEFGQLLSALRLSLARVKEELARRSGTKGPVLRKHVTAAIKAADHLFVSLRELVHGLRPAVLDEFGLVVAVESLLEDMRQATGLDGQLSVEPKNVESLIGQELEGALFRVMQELVTNVVRHASATKIDMRLSYANGTISLTVQDNGRGGQLTIAKGKYGLRGIHERTELLGGAVKIQSEQGRGTTVTVTLPVGSPI